MARSGIHIFLRINYTGLNFILELGLFHGERKRKVCGFLGIYCLLVYIFPNSIFFSLSKSLISVTSSGVFVSAPCMRATHP